MAGRAWLATNTYQMRPLTFSLQRQKFTSHFSAEIYLSSSSFSWKYFTSSALTCCLSNLTLFPSEVLLFQAFPSLQVQTSFDTFLDRQSQFERDHMAGGFSEAITSLVQGFSGSSSHKAYHWIVPHSFLGAPWEGNPGGAAPGGKPIRPD